MNEKNKSCTYWLASCYKAYSGRQSVTETDDDYELSNCSFLFY